MLKRMMTTAATLAVAVAAASSAPAVNLLTNGGFETGSFSGWTVTFDAADDHPQVVIRTDNVGRTYPTGAFLEGIPSDPLTGGGSGELGGTYGAYFSSDITASGALTTESISQNVALVAGTNYTFGFDYYLPANGQANPGDAFFTASFAGTPFATFTASTLPCCTWSTVSGGFFAPSVGVGTLQLNFASPGAFMFGKDFVIDRVYLTATSSLVPEPASWAMMVAGFGLMGAAMRRRSKVNVLFA